jgi:thiamine-monophosphate kinase
LRDSFALPNSNVRLSGEGGMAEDKSGSGEDDLISRYFKPLVQHPAALSLTDDAAVYTPPPGDDLVVTKDALVAGVHFFADDPPDAIAQKSLRVNLSDLAAKGAKPEGFLLALALPAGTTDEWLAVFADGMKRDIATFGCALLGGDTVHTPGPLMVSITAFGTLPNGTMVKRSGAKVGDRIFVTGTIGDAALALKLRREKTKAPLHLLDRYLLPQPRTALAPVLRAHANASMDVSDGLAGDIAKLCKASSVSGKVDVAKVPLSDEARALIGSDPVLQETAMTGGDDYEILTTVADAEVDGFSRAARAVGVAVTEIGLITEGRDLPAFLDVAGKPLTFKHMSFSHF